MEIRDSEKLILVLLTDIYDKLGVDTGIDTKVIREAIYGGHHWAIGWEHQGVFPTRVDSDEDVTLVVNVLDMWDFIERAAEGLAEPDRQELRERAAPFGEHVSFHGFDGNNESQAMSIARMLIGPMGRWERFARRDLNSHMPTIDGYRRMLAVFEPIRATLIGRDMSVDELAAVLTARRHPERT